MDTHRYDEYMERHEDDDVIDVYQKEIEGYQSFMLILMDEEPGSSKKCLKKSKRVPERQERHE
jgi:hypothetical protein